MNHIDVLLSRLPKVKQTGQDKWAACCPAHDDKSPSLSIKLLPDGKILLHCFAGCSYVDVTEALGLKPKDLFIPNNQFDRREYRKQKLRSAAREQAEYDWLILNMAKSAVIAGETLKNQDREAVKEILSRGYFNDGR